MTEIVFARGLFLAFFVLLVAAAIFLPSSEVFRGAPDRRRWRDLRVWAFLLVAIHAVVYVIF